jgi:hypothetical protein
VEISIITDHPVCPIGYLVHQATLAVKDGPRPRDRDARDHDQPRAGARARRQDRVASRSRKLGDLAIWSGDPLDVMQRAHRVFIEGRAGLRLVGSGGVRAVDVVPGGAARC